MYITYRYIYYTCVYYTHFRNESLEVQVNLQECSSPTFSWCQLSPPPLEALVTPTPFAVFAFDKDEQRRQANKACSATGLERENTFRYSKNPFMN